MCAVHRHMLQSGECMTQGTYSKAVVSDTDQEHLEGPEQTKKPLRLLSHVSRLFASCFYCCPGLLTSSLRGVGVNKRPNDV